MFPSANPGRPHSQDFSPTYLCLLSTLLSPSSHSSLTETDPFPSD